MAGLSTTVNWMIAKGIEHASQQPLRRPCALFLLKTVDAWPWLTTLTFWEDLLKTFELRKHRGVKISKFLGN